jgi:serpin B
MINHKLLIVCLLHILLISYSKEPEGPKQPKQINLTPKAGAIIAESNAFGIDLFRSVTLAEDQNMMLSPLSPSVALTVLLNGSNSATYKQIKTMLGYDGMSITEINEAYQSLVSQLLTADPEINLALANAVWYNQDFLVKASLMSIMDTSFDAKIAGLDFNIPSSVDTINGWAKDNTNEKITRVLDIIDPGTVMFLMNALYFKGNWTYQFDEGQTADFSGIADADLIVDFVKQNTYVAVYEEGTEAAAVTTNGIKEVSMPPTIMID